MIRLFEEHQVRRTTELSSSLWDFSQVTDGKNTPVGKVTVPSCWESYPGFEAYRGQGLYERSFEAGGDMRIVFKGTAPSPIQKPRLELSPVCGLSGVGGVIFTVCPSSFRSAWAVISVPSR